MDDRLRGRYNKTMTAPIRHLLENFDHLSDAEQAEAASLILRKTLNRKLPPLSDDDLAMAADELFTELDKREAEDAG
jgi:hypothetical protein